MLAGVSFDIIDIDHDPDLLLLYDERVPVLLDSSGDVVLEGLFTDDAVRALRR